ncbi:MAG: class I SAM-dependent methyltransferase [Alphaproteobacteria bacterium]|nr:MAG: class I SAM-dependent methyltransferase [Alphaproteobacteria bacterium]
MTADRETLAFYDSAAPRYAARFSRARPDRDLAAFIAALAPGARVLDLGCGPGQGAAMLRDAGLVVDAVDASEGMARLARERFGIDVTVQEFSDIDAVARYDGIWANFSLLHAPRAEMPAHLRRLHRALKPGGLLHLGLKLGRGEGRDHLGRFYAYYEEAELDALLRAAGFAPVARRTGRATGMAGTPDPFIIMRARA